MRNIAFWKKAPFARLLFPLVCGILVQWYLPVSGHTIFIASLVLFSAAIIILFYKKLSFTASIGRGILLHVFLFFLGITLCYVQQEPNTPGWYGHNSTNAPLLLRISEEPVPKTNSWQAEATVLGIYDSNEIKTVHGKMILYFAKNADVGQLHYGDEIISTGVVQPIRNAGNPGSFNYENYAAYHGWYHTQYLTAKDYFVTGKNSGRALKKISFACRNYVLSVLDKHLGADKDVVGIAKALIIGYKTDLDKNLVQAYSNTGIVHIVAISGMHLAIFYALLEFLFNLFPWTRNSKKKIIPILFLLWGFSLITGGSASVLRSALMFTFMLLGKNYFKQSSAYNSLAVSAFCLLCYDPFFLWDVGFQLSYLAVFGIVWMQKPIFHLLYIPNKYLSKVWELTSVTLAAQLITFPLTVYYFHQFPILFLFVNLLAIPISGIALYCGIALIVFAQVPYLSWLIAKLLYYSLYALNYIVAFFNSMPVNTWDGLYASLPNTLLFYLFLFSGFRFFQVKNKWMLFVCIFCAVGLASVRLMAFTEKQNQQKIIVYNTAKYTAVDFIDRGKYIFIGDSILTHDDLLRNFHLKPSRISLQATEEVKALPGFYRKENLIIYNGKSIFMADSIFKPQALQSPIKADILLLGKNAFPIAVYLKAIQPALVICNGSNNMWKTAAYKKQCEDLHLPFFNTTTQGAYILDVSK